MEETAPKKDAPASEREPREPRAASPATAREPGTLGVSPAGRLHDLVHDLDAVVWEAESDGGQWRFTFVNKTVEAMFGYPIESWLDRPGFWLDRVYPDDRARLTGFYGTLAGRSGQPPDGADRRLEIEYRARTASGSLLWLHDVAHLAGARNGTSLLRGVMMNVTPHKRIEALIAHLASHDALTDLPNRTTLLDRLNRALARARRQKYSVGVLHVGLDRFQAINDAFGSNVGDRLIQHAAARLAGCLRESDTVARLDGDTFVAVAEDIGHAQDVALIGQRLLESLGSEPFSVQPDGKEVHVTVSVGGAIYPGDGDDAQALLKHAEIAMHRAKREGGNRQRLFAPEWDARARKRFGMVGELRRALARGELSLLYQPREDLSSGHVVAVEAMLGWNHPDRGPVPRAEFLPLLEETGLVVEAGEWLLRTVATHLRAWDAAGVPPLRVAVSVSGRQLRAGNLVEELVRQLADTGFDTARLDLEIAQSVVMQSGERIAAVLRRLDAMGVRIALDDFGVAPVSIERLSRLPIRAAKIAPVLLRNLPADEHDASTVRGIVSLARGLGLATVAAGVEREAQRTFLRACGCDAIQGDLLGPSLKAEEFVLEIVAGDVGR